MPGGLFLQRGYLETCKFIVHSVTYTYMFCNLVCLFFKMKKIEKQSWRNTFRTRRIKVMKVLKVI